MLTNTAPIAETRREIVDAKIFQALRASESIQNLDHLRMKKEYSSLLHREDRGHQDKVCLQTLFLLIILMQIPMLIIIGNSKILLTSQTMGKTIGETNILHG